MRNGRLLRALTVICIAIVAIATMSCSDMRGTRVSGCIVDDETGRPVAREEIWIHAFDDAAKRQVTLKPSGDTSFALRIEGDPIRLVVADISHAYKRYEKTLTAHDGAINVDVRLEPTHWVRFHGKLSWRDGARLRPIREGDGNVSNALIDIGGERLAPDKHGAFSLRLPRERLEVWSLDTSRAAVPRVIDLTGYTGDEYEADLVLEP